MDTDPRLIRGFQLVAGLIALLVLVQAVLAGQFLTGEEEDLESVHKIVGYALFILAVVQLAFAWLGRDAWRYRMVIWSVVILLLTVAQVGLGDASHDSSSAEAIHIPAGVLLFSLTSIVTMLSFMDERAKSALRGTG